MTTTAVGAVYAPPAASATASTRQRIASIDVVRGAVMVFMALDHVRDFVSRSRFQPEDLSRATAALFATRWITHFCAPAFFLLAGLGIGIYARRARSKREVARFLVTRGLWLLVLELVVTPLAWRLSFDVLPAFALVLWALGWSMIIMAAAIYAPRAALLAVSLLLVAGHNLFDGVAPDRFGALGWLWQVLHVQSFVIPGVLLVAYPLVPWVAVMALGYLLAETYGWEQERRRAWLVRTGLVATVLFILLRALNGYGDPGPWSVQRSAALTVASFLNVRKYPPSLLFLLMTLGPTLVALALTEKARGRVAHWLSVYGRVPLFYYCTHILVAHLAGMVIMFAQGGGLRRIPVFTDPGSLPAFYGLPLAGVYVAWAAVVLVMYYPCRAFARLKERRTDWWLRYL